MIALIDNYDSFTHNVYQYLCQITEEPVEVYRNDKISLEALKERAPSCLVVSPGPGRPEEAGISVEAIRFFGGKIPVLGICLGHQAMAAAFGGRVVQAQRIVHGKVEDMDHDGLGVFRGLPATLAVTRYHSLAVEEASLPGAFEVSARSRDGEIMGIRHREFQMEGLQFHPESIGSGEGMQMIANFMDYKRHPFDFKKTVNALFAGEFLSLETAADFMDEVTRGNLSAPRMAGILCALNTRPFSPEEIAGCAGVLLEKRVPVRVDFPVLDTCGTGGDGLGTFNISSFAALIASAAGVRVAKHGNRAISSLSGSADFYQQMGIRIDLTPRQSEELLKQTGFAFLFAPVFHGAMRHAAPVRRDLGVKTIINCLGPLSNPAGAENQLIGVFDEDLCLPMARAARQLGVKNVMVVHGKDGLDEISVSGPTRIVYINARGEEKDFVFDPSDVSLPCYPLEELKGGASRENAEQARQLLAGKGEAAIRQAVLLNAGAALLLYGLVSDLAGGYKMAEEALKSGQVARHVESIASVCKGFE